MPAPPVDLGLLLLTVAKARLVHRDGIHFGGLRYVAPTLAASVTAHVAIRYDPRDMAEIRVYHDDAFLCTAINPDLASSTVTFQQLKSARADHRNQLKKHVRTVLSLADGLPFDDRYTPAPTGNQLNPPEPAPPAKPLLHLYAED